MVKRLTLSLAFGLVIRFVSLMLAGSPRTSAASSTILIDRVYYDTYFPGQPEEAFRLINVSTAPVSLTDWIVTDGEGTITLTGSITPGASLWIARTAISFTLAFGYSPTYEYEGHILNGRDAIVLIPKQPLTPGATYTVSITANGQSYSWAFTVSSTARAAGEAQGVIQMR